MGFLPPIRHIGREMRMQPPKIPKSLDNKQQGRVIDELRAAMEPKVRLSVISAYFTIYAYEALKKELSGIAEMRFIFTSPSYIKQKSDFQREFYIAHNHLAGNEFELKLKSKLTQSAIAKECADWLKKSAYQVLSAVEPGAIRTRLCGERRPGAGCGDSGQCRL